MKHFMRYSRFLPLLRIALSRRACISIPQLYISHHTDMFYFFSYISTSFSLHCILSLTLSFDAIYRFQSKNPLYQLYANTGGINYYVIIPSEGKCFDR